MALPACGIDFIKDRIDKCGKNGVLIIVTKMPDKARIEDMQAMLQSIKEPWQVLKHLAIEVLIGNGKPKQCPA
jgi:hypothetical protein